jgi:RNA polymerase sigma factor (sigma-70 family)
MGRAEAARERGVVLPRSDELLARLVASGGEQPFRALYGRYQAQLYRYCHSIVGNEADAQDALQSTFTRALVALREGKRNAPLRPWLYRIAHNESISLLRARRQAISEPERERLAVGQSVEESADTRARLELLLADLAQLAERARAALVMRELGGLSHEEIAAALQISVGAAKQAIFEARSALFELAEGRAMACNEVMRRLSDGDRRVLRGRQVRAHLRDCASCSAFAAGMPARQAQLRALCPVLPPAAAAAVLSRALEGATIHGGRAAVGGSAASSGSTIGGTGGASAGMSSTAASAAKVLAAIVAPKALLATAVIAGAAAGASGLVSGSPAHHAARGLSPGATTTLRPSPTGHAVSTAHARNSPALSHRGSLPKQAQGSQKNPGSGPAKAQQSRAPTSAPSGQNNPNRASPANNTSVSGHGDAASGHSGNVPGQSGSAPGLSGSAPGLSGSAQGRSESAPGLSGSAQGRGGSAPGLSGSAPGHSGESHGNSSAATSRKGSAPGLAQHDHGPPGHPNGPGDPHGL